MSDARLLLTDEELHEASCCAYVMEHCPAERHQIAAELAYLRSVFSAAKRDRARLPTATQRQVDRWPRYAKRVVFDRVRPSLELQPCQNPHRSNTPSTPR